MRRLRRWLLVVFILAAVVIGSVGLYHKFIDTAYVESEFYADTGLATVPKQADTTQGIVYQDQPGRVTLVLRRGEPHGVITTEHDWWEIVTIDMPRPSPGQRIILDSADVRVLFFSYKFRQFPTIGDNGIRGHIDIDSVGQRRIMASYEIVIDAVYPRLVPESRHREVTFRGRSTFRAASRPDGAVGGQLWIPPNQSSRTARLSVDCSNPLRTCCSALRPFL